MLSRLLIGLMTGANAPAIAHEELLQAHSSEECTVVDVREAVEYGRGHIPGAINQPLSRFDPARVPRGGRVVLICQAGTRSAAALRQMIAAGRQDAQHYPAGMAGWQGRRGPLET